MGAWHFFRGPVDLRESPAAGASSAMSAAGGTRTDRPDVVGVAPAATVAPQVAPQVAQKSPVPGSAPPAPAPGADRPAGNAAPGAADHYSQHLGHEFESTPDKRALFEELKAMGTADAYFFAARILRDCFDVGGKGLDAAMKTFMAKIPGSSASIASRIDAFRQLIEPCAGFEDRPIPVHEVQQTNWMGVQKNDPRVVASAMKTGQMDSNEHPFKIAAALLDKSDPYVIADSAVYLGGPAAGGFVIDGKPVEASASEAVMLAWEMVACDYGAPCGPTSPAVLHACADRGVCGIGSFDQLARITMPDSYQRALEFRAQIRAALQSRDYPAIGLDPARRPRPKG